MTVKREELIKIITFSLSRYPVFFTKSVMAYTKSVRARKLLRILGFLIWVLGLGLTFFVKADVYTFMVWVIGLYIYFVYDIREEKERARIVQEAQ